MDPLVATTVANTALLPPRNERHARTKSRASFTALYEYYIRFRPNAERRMPNTQTGILFLRWRRTQVAKGRVCKTLIQRFESARRLH